MRLGKLGRIVGVNLRSNAVHFLLASIGVVVGIAAFAFFLALGAGVRSVVLGKIFPLDQLEVVAKTLSLDLGPLSLGMASDVLMLPYGAPVAEYGAPAADKSKKDKSKDKGGNVVAAYVASLHAQAEERRVMEQELRGALDRGEFELYYQPVVTAEDGTLNGFEALIRWHNQKQIGRAHV